MSLGLDADYFTISIHALCEEGDTAATLTLKAQIAFLSTPSARRATRYGVSLAAVIEFLSTPSARRATPCPLGRGSIAGYFYPRPLRGGRPPGSSTNTPTPRNFYPRPLRGGRRRKFRRYGIERRISIHALCEEGDLGRTFLL